MKDIALEEGHHFTLLKERLAMMGYHYGCMPVIPKLSLVIEQTNHSLIERIALISLVHEGRGVKAVEKLLIQLDKSCDDESVKVVKIIQRDEVKHFSMGWKWFYLICGLLDFDPAATITALNYKHKSHIKLPPSTDPV